MVTLQEQFEKDFPDKSVSEIDIYNKYDKNTFTNYDLDLSKNVNLTNFNCYGNEITSLDLSKNVNLTNFDCSSNNLTSIDISKNVNLTNFNCHDNNLTFIDLSKQKDLTYLDLHDNNLTFIDFLNQLPNPEKLELLWVYNNNIQPTDISIFSKFVNLCVLKTGTMKYSLKKGKHNKFYGSLKSWKKLTRLLSICIEATDIDEGLEYLPTRLARNIKKAKEGVSNLYGYISCSPHNTNAKCSQIQDQLRPFNYDLEAWQLAHPEKMLIARPELFTDDVSEFTDDVSEIKEELEKVKRDKKEAKITLKLFLDYKERILKGEKITHAGKEISLEHCEEIKKGIEKWIKEEPEKVKEKEELIKEKKEEQKGFTKQKWLKALNDKISESKEILIQTKEQEADKIKKISRLESKISELETAKSTISQQTQTEFSTQNKSTQTDLTMEQIKNWEQTDKNKTLYQKFIEKYGKK